MEHLMNSSVPSRFESLEITTQRLNVIERVMNKDKNYIS